MHGHVEPSYRLDSEYLRLVNYLFDDIEEFDPDCELVAFNIFRWRGGNLPACFLLGEKLCEHAQVTQGSQTQDRSAKIDEGKSGPNVLIGSILDIFAARSVVNVLHPIQPNIPIGL